MSANKKAAMNVQFIGDGSKKRANVKTINKINPQIIPNSVFNRKSNKLGMLLKFLFVNMPEYM